MPMNTMLPQQQQPQTPIDLSIRNAKLFEINKFNVYSFDELIRQSSNDIGVEFEMFFANSLETQWGYLRVVDGKLKKFLPLLEVNILSVTAVNPHGLDAEGYIVKYCLNTIRHDTEKYIPGEAMSHNNLLEYFALPPPCSKRIDDLCNRLLKHIIIKKALDSDPSNFIEIGSVQGWRISATNKAIFEARNRYPEVLYPLLPSSILHCEKAVFTLDRTINKLAVYKNFTFLFDSNIELKLLYLLRITSFNSSFSHRCGMDFDLLPNVVPSETIPSTMITAIVQNNGYSSGNLLTLAGNVRELKKRITESNDTALAIIDDTKLDEAKQRRTGIAIVERAILSHSKGNRFVSVIISNYAAEQIMPELFCPFILSNLKCACDCSLVRILLLWNDTRYISGIEQDFQLYWTLYSKNNIQLTNRVPSSIPSCRHSAYICLITAARTYDQFFEPFFGEETERFVTEWLSSATENGSTVNAELVRHFGKLLNQEIQSGRFHFITRTKFITFDKTTDSVIIDDDNIYIETGVIADLAASKMDLHSINSLTDALNADESLVINDHHSKCYRFKIQNSAGDAEWLYTYGISKQIISKENRRRLDYADQDKFFLSYDELSTSGILPLGAAFDGCFVGKDVSYLNKGNDSIFFTGPSGQGKTCCAITMRPSFAMLGSRILVFDVSGSFSREEVLGLNADPEHRPLPEDVVEAMFDFIEVGEGKSKLPINPLYIGDCTGLSDKKRRVVSFIKAAAGKLDKDELRIVNGLISTMLKNHRDLTAVPMELLCDTLKNGGKAGWKAHNLISAVLDDLEAIGWMEQSWGEFFEHSKKIPVISLGHEESDSVHQLLDVLLASAFEWQHDHKSKPMLIAIDEIKRQSFADGCPLHTIITQGRKFGCRLMGMTQEYISRDSHAIDIMREAGIKLFFEPANGRDKIASELGYKSAAHADFGSLKVGEFILKCDLYNKIDGANEPAVIVCRTLKFENTPLYQHFNRGYNAPKSESISDDKRTV